jgi:alpha-L-fucosidase 2
MLKRRDIAMILGGLALLGAIGATSAAASSNKLWYRQPARRWEEALPLGNGRLGAMVFGTVPEARLSLNEESLWAGEPFGVYPDDFATHLKEVQRLVLDGRINEARQLGLEKLTKSPTSFRSYEPLGDLLIEMDHGDDVSDYRRELDLETGLARVSYRVGQVRFERETLISAVDDVLAMRLAVDTPGKLNARIRLTRPKDMRVTALDDRLEMDGQIVDIPAPDGYDDNPDGSGPGGAHMRFAGRLVVRTVNGAVKAGDETLTIEGADGAILLFTAATDFSLAKMNFNRSIDPGRTADTIVEKAARKMWDTLLDDHMAEHRSHFNRVHLDLAGETERDALPTDVRLAAVKQGQVDDGLLALYFQFGRYLLMSSSRRPGRLPANLQGIWSRRMWAPWEADYHLNINLQMNYWPADLCNLSETMDPLVDWLSRVAEKGRVSADRLYGARGWIAFTAVNLFGRTTPSGSTKASQFQNGSLDPLAGAWMSLTLWRHYKFTGDREFLAQRAYPILTGASEFLLDYLMTDQNGRLVIVPSTSPENEYLHPQTGRPVRISRGSTYHTSIVRAVFEAVIAAADILECDRSYQDRLRQVIAKLPPIEIGRDGTIQEWIEDYEEREPGHRHISHLIGLHPFALITTDDAELWGGW